MSINLPSRVLTRSASIPRRLPRHPSSTPPRNKVVSTKLSPNTNTQANRQSDAATDRSRRAASKTTPKPPLSTKPAINTLSEEYLKRKPTQQSAAAGALKQNMPVRGTLASSSIFSDIDVPSPQKPSIHPSSPTTVRPSSTEPSKPAIYERNPATLSAALIPYPDRRARWHRKMVICSIRRRGRLTRRETLWMTERQSLSKSHFMKTSVKKLAPLARQIAGKSIEEAILQMRFSPKKAAKEVKEHLELARNAAIVERGMGLGKVTPETAGWDYSTSPKEKKLVLPSSPSIEIKLKDGRRKRVTDQTDIYIDQAWVGRGSYGREPEYRARGRVNILRPPHTSISVLLKEEKTRIREEREREEKALRKRREKMWVQLPDRKVTAQRQYYSW